MGLGSVSFTGEIISAMPFEPYNAVFALILHWEDAAEKDFKKQGEKLGTVLKAFKFQVKEYAIPSEKPHQSLNGRLQEFLEEDNDRTLLIVYYSGHALTGRDRNHIWVW